MAWNVEHLYVALMARNYHSGGWWSMCWIPLKKQRLFLREAKQLFTNTAIRQTLAFQILFIMAGATALEKSMFFTSNVFFHLYRLLSVLYASILYSPCSETTVFGTVQPIKAHKSIREHGYHTHQPFYQVSAAVHVIPYQYVMVCVFLVGKKPQNFWRVP